jgi:hypothetical protein
MRGMGGVRLICRHSDALLLCQGIVGFIYSIGHRPIANEYRPQYEYTPVIFAMAQSFVEYFVAPSLQQQE